MEPFQAMLDAVLEVALGRRMPWQLLLAAGATLLALVVARILGARLARVDGVAEGRLQRVRRAVVAGRPLLFPVLNVLLLGGAVEIAARGLGYDVFLRALGGLAGAHLLWRVDRALVRTGMPSVLLRWIGIPLVVLLAVGILEEVTAWLDRMALSVGNLRLSALMVARTLVFGSLLFWLGRVSRRAGTKAIRSRSDLDPDTREIFAKLFDIALFVVVFLLLLNVVGINLTTLAVVGGAVGVGLGFGLQQIASNFISGIIILLDRSLRIGDYVQFDESPLGRVSQLNMRYSVIETFDGKEVMVPNERFITETFVNWTHSNPKQRYALEFQVAYETDLDALFPLLREVVGRHPSVLSGPDVPVEERPDAEIAGFGESGIDLLVEFWMEGIDDGRNRVGADLLYDIWKALRETGVSIPFPQREVRVLGGSGRIEPAP